MFQTACPVSMWFVRQFCHSVHNSLMHFLCAVGFDIAVPGLDPPVSKFAIEMDLLGQVNMHRRILSLKYALLLFMPMTRTSPRSALEACFYCHKMNYHIFEKRMHCHCRILYAEHDAAPPCASVLIGLISTPQGSDKARSSSKKTCANLAGSLQDLAGACGMRTMERKHTSSCCPLLRCTTLRERMHTSSHACIFRLVYMPARVCPCACVCVCLCMLDGVFICACLPACLCVCQMRTGCIAHLPLADAERRRSRSTLPPNFRLTFNPNAGGGGSQRGIGLVLPSILTHSCSQSTT